MLTPLRFDHPRASSPAGLRFGAMTPKEFVPPTQSKPKWRVSKMAVLGWSLATLLGWRACNEEREQAQRLKDIQYQLQLHTKDDLKRGERLEKHMKDMGNLLASQNGRIERQTHAFRDQNDRLLDLTKERKLGNIVSACRYILTEAVKQQAKDPSKQPVTNRLIHESCKEILESAAFRLP